MKFRIIQRHNGYFSQVKKGFFWHRIAKHPSNEFGLYSNKTYRYPLKSLPEAQKLIKDYALWIKDERKSFSVIKEIILDNQP